MKFQATSFLILIASFVAELTTNPLNDLHGISWYQAVKLCDSLEMKIVSITSEKKNHDILEYLIHNDFFEKLNDCFWTSGCLIADTWFWTANGNVIDYFDWEINEPNQMYYEPCIGMAQNGWHDLLQVGNNSVICE